jgi:hypothetical protein
MTFSTDKDYIDNLQATKGEGLEGLEADVFQQWLESMGATQQLHQRIRGLEDEITKARVQAQTQLGRTQGQGQVLIALARKRGDIVDSVADKEGLEKALGATIDEVKPATGGKKKTTVKRSPRLRKTTARGKRKRK